MRLILEAYSLVPAYDSQYVTREGAGACASSGAATDPRKAKSIDMIPEASRKSPSPWTVLPGRVFSRWVYRGQVGKGPSHIVGGRGINRGTPQPTLQPSPHGD